MSQTKSEYETSIGGVGRRRGDFLPLYPRFGKAKPAARLLQTLRQQTISELPCASVCK